MEIHQFLKLSVIHTLVCGWILGEDGILPLTESSASNDQEIKESRSPEEQLEAFLNEQKERMDEKEFREYQSLIHFHTLEQETLEKASIVIPKFHVEDTKLSDVLAQVELAASFNDKKKWIKFHQGIQIIQQFEKNLSDPTISINEIDIQIHNLLDLIIEQSGDQFYVKSEDIHPEHLTPSKHHKTYRVNYLSPLYTGVGELDGTDCIAHSMQSSDLEIIERLNSVEHSRYSTSSPLVHYLIDIMRDAKENEPDKHKHLYSIGIVPIWNPFEYNPRISLSSHTNLLLRLSELIYKSDLQYDITEHAVILTRSNIRESIKDFYVRAEVGKGTIPSLLKEIKVPGLEFQSMTPKEILEEIQDESLVLDGFGEIAFNIEIDESIAGLDTPINYKPINPHMVYILGKLCEQEGYDIKVIGKGVLVSKPE